MIQVFCQRIYLYDLFTGVNSEFLSTNVWDVNIQCRQGKQMILEMKQIVTKTDPENNSGRILKRGKCVPRHFVENGKLINESQKTHSSKSSYSGPSALENASIIQSSCLGVLFWHNFEHSILAHTSKLFSSSVGKWSKKIA